MVHQQLEFHGPRSSGNRFLGGPLWKVLDIAGLAQIHSLPTVGEDGSSEELSSAAFVDDGGTQEDARPELSPESRCRGESGPAWLRGA